jgi:hypothetical protein
MNDLRDAKLAFISVDLAAARLNLSSAWLRRECEAGRVPALRVGQRFMVDLNAAHAALVQRSVESCSPQREAATCV